MEIESTLTRKTYAKLMLAFALRSSTFYFIAAILIVFLILGFIYKSFFNYVTVILALAILYYVIWLLYQCFSSNNNNRYFFVKRHFTFRDDNILVKFPSLMLEQVIKWEAFSEWKRAARCYVLIFTNGKMAIIPSSDIPTSEIPAFENLLRQKIDKIVITKQTEGD